MKVPTLIMHGDKDELVPFEQGRKIYEAANEPKEFYTIPEPIIMTPTLWAGKSILIRSGIL